jgi:hypothetical protein
MFQRAARFLLPTLLAALLPISATSAQQPPPGYQLFTAPQTSGGLLLARRQGVASATQLLLHGLREVAPFFDRRPEALWAFAESRDQYAEAAFRVTSRQLPLTGVAFATLGAGGGTLGFVFDTPNALAQSLPRLFELTGASQGGPATGCAPSPQRWQVVPFPDGSGQVQLPEGWHITGASQGAVSAEGPQGLINRAIRMTVMTPAAAAQSPAPVPLPVADPTDPATPLLAVWAYAAVLNQQQGLPSARVSRVLHVTPMPLVSGFIHNALVEFEVDFRGRPYRAIAHVLVSGVMDAFYLYKESNGFAPAECFAEFLPTLWQILGSAQTASHVFTEILQRAHQSQQEAHEIWWESARNRERIQDRIHPDAIETIRGMRVVEDTDTGNRTDVNLGYSADIVRRLNNQEGRDRYREIPLRDLNR